MLIVIGSFELEFGATWLYLRLGKRDWWLATPE